MDTITQFTVKQPRQIDHNDDSHKPDFMTI